jgi:enoyl-CoA hydratase/carnithine racemase
MPAPSVKVELTREGALGLLTLSNPPVGALSGALVEGLRSALGALRDDPPAALVISSALDRHFCAGAELKEFGGSDTDTFVTYVRGVRDTFQEVEALEFPTLAAIDGAALGGGLELALACDLIFAGPQARLGLPEIKLGILPGAGGTQRLPRRIGLARAKEFMLSGRQVDSEEADRLGLAIAAPEGAREAATQWARAYLDNSTLAGNAILGCAEAALNSDREAGRDLELSEIERLYGQGDARERIARFIESRRR